jgi:hypothetical protein
MQTRTGLKFTHPTNGLIVETEPVTLLEVLDVGIVMTT